jgi:hypothetical protein
MLVTPPEVSSSFNGCLLFPSVGMKLARLIAPSVTPGAG